jgi:DNA-binding transcriptional regulator LsrR (DeoR family)
MRDRGDARLLVRVARMYYSQGKRQPEIARTLGISQPSVSRLLQRAIGEGVVRITVAEPPGVYAELEEALETRYNLLQAVVANAHDEVSTISAIGGAAASYLESTLRHDDVIGVSSWSETLLAAVDSMRPVTSASGCHIVQILGGLGNPMAETHATQLIRRLAELLKGRAAFLPAPGVTASAATKRAYFEDPFVGEAYSYFDRLTVSLVGIGALEPSRLLASSGNVFSSTELEALARVGAVGDICLRFFDAEGKAVSSALDDRTVAIELQQLRRTPRTVALAGGPHKVHAIRGALRGRLVNTLVTDVHTARALMEE